MKKRMIIYVNSNIQNHEFIYTGITFSEFIECLQNPIKNILLLKSDYMGNNYVNNFELVEGEKEINMLKKEDIYNYGDFCFADYSELGDVDNLKDEEIAELLYMAHMCKALRNPFINVLNNRFVYLAHDDGFFCKLYCREATDFFDVLNGKIVGLIKNITKKDINNLDVGIQESLLKLTEEGLLLDFGETKANKGEISTKIYSIGKHTDMDKILNECQKLKETASNQRYIKYKDGKWYLEQAI